MLYMTTRSDPQKLYGLLIKLNSVDELIGVSKAIREGGYECWDAITPFPVHGLDKAMGIKRSKIPYLTLAGGLSGFFTGVSMVWYMNAYDYPLIVGGKPFFSPIFPFPVFYELTILFAAFGTFFGMFLMNRLPQHHHPIFDAPGIEKGSDDALFLYIEAKDKRFKLQETTQFIEKIVSNRTQPIYTEA